MPDVPAEAVRAAMARRADLLSDRPDPTALSDETLTRLMLEAAAPILAQHVAARILAHMEACDLEAIRRGHPIPRGWRRDLRIAAQVATLAFNTDEDNKRLAAEAVQRGEVAGCNPEVPDGG
jgi:hypothetical protein